MLATLTIIKVYTKLLKIELKSLWDRIRETPKNKAPLTIEITTMYFTNKLTSLWRVVSTPSVILIIFFYQYL